MPEIIPAILTNDLEDFKAILKKLEGLVDWVQIDIMDGKFVNNKSIKLKDLEGIKHNFNLEAHLMVAEPQKYFKVCDQLNIKRVLFSVEPVKDLDKVIKEARKFKFEVGFSINPSTPLDNIIPFLDKVDVVLFLAVTPGWQGQKFEETVLEKIKKLKDISPDIKIEIDGGVNLDNIKSVVEAGADYIDVGSAIVKSENIKETIKKLKAISS